MDVTQALKDTENALRDFIAAVLSQSLGSDWVEKCGISPDHIEKWRERKKSEESRQEAGVVEERLIYYAEFYQLSTILEKHWSGEFSKALGDWKTMKVWLSELQKLRDPDAHRRELLIHQKHLIMGIEGEIRTRIIRYRSKKETSQDCFPRIESARDSLGNIWTPESPFTGKDVTTGMVLRVGDVIDFVLTARDPEDLALLYGIYGVQIGSNDDVCNWQNSPNLRVTLTEQNIANSLGIILLIKSSRSYHANQLFDDSVKFSYQVLPTTS